MKIRRYKGESIKSFSCGDDELDDFLLNDALHYDEQMLAHTYILENFYISNGFKPLVKHIDDNRDTIPMFYDLMQLKDIQKLI